ncbi:MAG: DUF4258 domain-containing protein [Thermoanaerobaculum sp.]
MALRLTTHAQEVLEKRRIPLRWVEKVVSNPEWNEWDTVDPSLEHRLGTVPEFGNRILRVVVRDVGSTILVITAYFDPRRRKL